MPAEAAPAPRIVLHAGFHKTGTTSAQAALKAHAPALEPFARCAWLTGRDPLLRLAANEARRFSAGDDSALPRMRRCLMQWAMALPLAPGQALILSSEDFAGHMPGDRGVTDYGAAVPLARVMANVMRAQFPGADLRFVYGTRGADAWLASLHWQLAKHDRMTDDAARYAARFADAVQVAPLLRRIARVTGAPVLAAPLETHGPRRLGPVEALYDAAGLPDALRATLAPVPAANQAPAQGLADAFVALNRQDMTPADRAAAKARLRGG